ncbi:NAD(P)-binding domain-containing protein [Actinocatenispora rupis]|uniref:Oxidoreductase n=1 Tax=Actinocatenispora rupis TaxID=519421 RepID=A0A8J3IVD8_9ACTN|nr:NAD(P)-binding domain-containing protein [Actinocatenispora rupis]GID09270.1 oxidoreductase [Actinocatenispora rupis]
MTYREIDALVIGGGQAGLSAAYHLRGYGVPFELLDHGDGPGGAWRQRWDSLVLGRTHRIHDLPGLPFGTPDPELPASVAVPAYFDRYERAFALPVRRPVDVTAVRRGPDDRLLVDTSAGAYAARAVVNATGTWERPFWPWYPGRETFRGRQLHTADYRSAAEFAGRHVVVVGGGASATQLLAEISQVATTTWVTRRPPEFREGPFTEELGRSVVAEVDRRVRAGLPPGSVVSATGLVPTPAVRAAMARGVLHRYPMFRRITPTGVEWADGRAVAADVILWCTGFRPALDHLAPLGLRAPSGGIRVVDTRVVAEPRLFLVGYGPSASTIGANRAGRLAARGVRDLVRPATPVGS